MLRLQGSARQVNRLLTNLSLSKAHGDPSCILQIVHHFSIRFSYFKKASTLAVSAAIILPLILLVLETGSFESFSSTMMKCMHSSSRPPRSDTMWKCLVIWTILILNDDIHNMCVKSNPKMPCSNGWVRGKEVNCALPLKILCDLESVSYTSERGKIKNFYIINNPSYIREKQNNLEN